MTVKKVSYDNMSVTNEVYINVICSIIDELRDIVLVVLYLQAKYCPELASSVPEV